MNEQGSTDGGRLGRALGITIRLAPRIGILHYTLDALGRLYGVRGQAEAAAGEAAEAQGLVRRSEAGLERGRSR